ncbi:hypothetical protein Tsubulata_023502 [Turnera subulata]|uniref:Uncharacterized protein n=1 Tax=Turnera subulata TaxID=218843 RepID=A0A9Q0GF88_9ROSI|nr:hypothetical protein Tsubulata_023502 [Turnera subulata]
MKPKLDGTCVNEVLRRCSVGKSQMGLRLFVWVGCQSSYTHRSYMYSKACDLFKIRENPQVVLDLMEGYRLGVVSVKTFKCLPEWTTCALLIAMALYDLAAILLPVEPLRILVELAISRDEDIPALVYEARPVTKVDSDLRNGVVRRRVWRQRTNAGDGADESLDTRTNVNPSLNSNGHPDSNLTDEAVNSVGSDGNSTRLIIAEEGRVLGRDNDLSAPLIDRRISVPLHRQENATTSPENLLLEGIGLGSTGAIKPGLGYFIFCSVLVGRAAMYDFMTVYAC